MIYSGIGLERQNAPRMRFNCRPQIVYLHLVLGGRNRSGPARVSIFMLPVLFFMVLACSKAPAEVPPDLIPPPGDSARAAPTYDDVTAAVAERRAHHAERYAAAGSEAARMAIVSAARSDIEAALVDEIFPPWFETPWAFYGTSVVPGEGEIACGYFVSTTLLHAGFQVERVRLAQQASEHIIQSFVAPRAIKRFRGVPVSTVIHSVQQQGDGLYLVGLDYHVGYLVNRGGQVDMCHASWIADGVVCEDAGTTQAMISHYTVTGKLLDDRMVVGWLDQTRFATRTN